MDMDLKIAGSVDGVAAFQMDIKVTLFTGFPKLSAAEYQQSLKANDADRQAEGRATLQAMQQAVALDLRGLAHSFEASNIQYIGVFTC